jgi:hypothetical protein
MGQLRGGIWQLRNGVRQEESSHSKNKEVARDLLRTREGGIAGGTEPALNDFGPLLSVLPSIAHRSVRNLTMPLTCSVPFPLLSPQSETEFAKFGRIPPSKLAEELRLYTRALNVAGLIGADLRVRSLDDVSKLIFAAYVERVTGKEFHGPIAGIVAEVTGSDYTEDALKQVRYRNKSMLADPTSWAARTAAFLGDLTDVLNARR